MPITTRNHNPFPDCVGLDQSVPQGLQNDFPLIVELRFGWEQKLWENVSLRMGIRGGIVHLDLKGCEITKGSRFAEYRRDKAAVERITYRDRQERSSKVELTGRLTLDPSTPAGRVGTDARGRGKSTTSMD